MQLKEYIEKYGFTQCGIAKRLNLSPRFFNFVVNGKRALPTEYWTPLIVLTNGEVTIEDLVELRKKYEKYYKSTITF